MRLDGRCGSRPRLVRWMKAAALGCQRLSCGPVAQPAIELRQRHRGVHADPERNFPREPAVIGPVSPTEVVIAEDNGEMLGQPGDHERWYASGIIRICLPEIACREGHRTSVR